MQGSWEYIEARLADQRATADRRRRIGQARVRKGSTRWLASALRSRNGGAEQLGGCRD